MECSAAVACSLGRQGAGPAVSHNRRLLWVPPSTAHPAAKAAAQGLFGLLRTQKAMTHESNLLQEATL